MDEIWEMVNAIRIKGRWDYEDIEDLTFAIRELMQINTHVADELRRALGALDALHKQLAFYRKVTGLKILR